MPSVDEQLQYNSRRRSSKGRLSLMLPPKAKARPSAAFLVLNHELHLNLVFIKASERFFEDVDDKSARSELLSVVGPPKTGAVSIAVKDNEFR